MLLNGIRRSAATALLPMAAMAALSAKAQAASIFSDNFSSGTLSNWSAPVTLSGTNGTADGGATVTTDGSGNNLLNLTNDIDGYTSNSSIARGRTYIYSEPFTAPLNQSPGLVTWTFNIAQTAAPVGFNYSSSGNYGGAVILAASTSDFADNNDDNGSSSVTNGNGNFGYALIWGSNSTDSNRLALVSFYGGLYGDAVAPTNGLPFKPIVNNSADDFGAGTYLSVKVTYDPASNDWSLYLANDGSAFSDPTTLGASNQVGSATTDTAGYVSDSLQYFGALYNYANGANSGAGNSALFDNFNIDVASVPEPTAVAGLAAVGLAGAMRRPRRRGSL